MRKITSAKLKLILLIVGLFLAFILLEAGLRLCGFVASSIQESKNLSSARKGKAYKIMCLGESTTARQYPGPLEEILNKRDIGVRFSVIDKGVIGTNTVVILSQLEENLDIYKPDMVVIMAGCNDEEISYYKGISGNNNWLFRNCRSYRFIRLLLTHMVKRQNFRGPLIADSKITSVPQEDLRTKYEKAGELLKKDIGSHPRNDTSYLELGWAYQHQNKLLESEEAFKKSIELNPGSDRAYVGLGWVYPMQGKFDEAEVALKKAIEINPRNAEAYLGLGRIYAQQGKFAEGEEYLKKAVALNPQAAENYFELGWFYRQSGRLIEAEESFKKNIPLNPKKDWGYKALKSLYVEMGKKGQTEERGERSADMYYPLTINNYWKLKDILDKSGIRMVCMQYPLRSVKPLKKIFAGPRRVIFVDNEDIFKKAIKDEGYKEYFTDMFAGDFGHCTGKGNRLIAQNLADVILKEIFNK